VLNKEYRSTEKKGAGGNANIGLFDGEFHIKFPYLDREFHNLLDI